MESAMALDEAASALESPRGRDVSCCTSSVGDVGVETPGNFGFGRRGIAMVDGQINSNQRFDHEDDKQRDHGRLTLRFDPRPCP